ncbi:MAG: tail fiber domain-containing protein [Ferruginibacter sp.]
MKKITGFSCAITFLLCMDSIGQNVGIGTNSPTNKFHIANGNSGATAWFNSSLVVESSTHNYVSILAPDDAETSVLFGNPTSNVSGGIVYNNSTNPNGLQFRANGNITNMVLSKDGNLAVGTATPTKYKAKINHGNFGLLLQNSFTSENWELVTFGNLQLFFNGLLRGTFNETTGVYTSNSDERLKTNVRPMIAMLGKIDQLKPATYQFKNTTDQQEYNGFIAQDVMKIFPSLVTHNVSKERNLDTYTMDYSGFGVIAIKGIQELQLVVEKQKEKIITLEERINKLETSFTAITRQAQQ